MIFLEPIGVKKEANHCKDIEYLPTSSIQDGARIIFEIGKDECYIDATNFVTKTVVEIQGENGASLNRKQFTGGISVGLPENGVINNLGHNLWEQVVLLETLLNYDDVNGKSFTYFKNDYGNIMAEFPTATYSNRGCME